MAFASQLHSPENNWHEGKQHQHHQENGAGDWIFVCDVITNGSVLKGCNEHKLGGKEQA